MANVGIENTQLGFVPLTLSETVNGVTTVVATPPADAFAAVSSGASLGATIGVDPGGSGATGVILTPLVLQSSPDNAGGGFTVNVTDSDGDVAIILGPYDITLVPVVPNIVAGTLTFSPNPVTPTAPGP